jgi:hypothetical protein
MNILLEVKLSLIINKRNSQDYLMEELFEVEDFLIIYTKNLLKSISPELALTNSLKQYNGKLKIIFTNLIKNIIVNGKSLNDSVHSTSSQFINSQSKQVFLFLMNFLEKDPKIRAERALKLLYRLRENKQLYLKRKNIVKAQEFKIKFLVLIMCLVLGLLASLSPWFSILSIINQSNGNLNLLDITISHSPSIYVIIAFFFICLINSYTLYRIIGIENKLIYTTLSSLLYILALFLSVTFLNLIIV